ncbi:inactive LRR receptor-like serine/threonine-protein kinase BIR2 [Rutidosis leptorrhynchoides]|uniref:inactive LRR receptor-like serine/threonine-protein kinase BIR2 n=1 Tax=Rutidosis leptorrhynchoides TaxID=125765 RepID=UPI003A99EE77
MGLRGMFPVGLQYCTALTSLDPSNNKLTGPLPFDHTNYFPHITSLNLSFNNFSGTIPPTIGDCSYINVLRLDHNQFTGQIPQNFSQLDRIKEFNVANNALWGPVL